jgi:hypothetical protein
MTGLVVLGLASRDTNAMACPRSTARVQPLPATTTSTDVVHLLGGVAMMHFLLLVVAPVHYLLLC